MRQYEVGIILHPDLEIDLEQSSEKVEAIITGLGGKIDNKDSWGKRKLAYPIKKQEWGLYVFFQVSLDPAKVQQLDNSLRITDEVMRYIIVSLEDVRPVSRGKQPAAKTEDTTEEKNDSAE